MSPAAAVSPERLRSLLLVGICAVVLLLRLNSGLARDLWEDEVIAAVHAQQPFWRLPVAVARHDVHPFLYFFQLHAWWLLGNGDVWLRLNSVMWNLAAIVSMLVVVRRLYGPEPAWIAALLFSFAAPVVWMSQELRPYSWMYVLIIWSFYFAEMQLRQASRGLLHKTATFLLCVGLIYSHAIAFVAVFFLGLYVLGRLVQDGAVGRGILGWGMLFGLCAVAAVPAILTDLLRDANLGGGAGALTDIAGWIPRLLLPQGESPLALTLAAGIYAGVVVLGVAVRDTRLMTTVFVVGPIALAVALDRIGMHLFKLNVFSTFITPYFTIVAARLLVRLPTLQRRAASAALALTFLAFSGLFFLDRVPTTGFRAVSDLIRSDAKAGDMVYAPQQSIFWGLARYMGTDRQGWQLEVAPPLTDQWRRMYNRLGPWFVTTFDLAPRTQILATRSGLPLVVGNESIPLVSHAHRVWLVTYRRADLPADFPPSRIGELHPRFTTSIGFLDVVLYQ